MYLPYWLRASVVCVVALAGAEFALRATGRFDPTEVKDPYQGFAGTSPLFRSVPGPGGLRSTSPNKLSPYRSESFPGSKEPGELRVFVLGGSSMYGATGPSGVSIPSMLQIYLRAHAGQKPVRVINAAGRGTGSLQNLEVAREIVEYEPDVVVLYPEGGEKNLIPPMPLGLLAIRDEESPLRVEARRLLAPLRSYVAVREGISRLLPQDAGAPFRSAFSAIAAYAVSQPFGQDTFTRLFEFKDDRVPVLMPQVIPQTEVDRANRRFERCLRETVELCRARGILPVLALPLHNLESSFYLRFHIDPAELKEGTADEWKRRYELGLELKRAGRCAEALPVLQSIRELYVEDRDEMLAYDIAECWEAVGEPDRQLAELTAMYRRREMIRRVSEIARELDVPLVEPFVDLVADAGGRLPGHEYFEDSYHPLPMTNSVVARSIVRALVEMGVVPELKPDNPRLTVAQRRVEELARSVPVAPAMEIKTAMYRGDYAEAARIARTVPLEKMSTDFVVGFYAGWALTRSGDVDEARRIYEHLVVSWEGKVEGLPDMSTDAGLVVHAFQGDVFAIF